MLPRATAALASLLLLALAPLARARAQTPPADPERPEQEVVRIVSISPWVDRDRPFRLRAQVTNASERTLEDVSIAARFFPRVVTRSELRAALDFGVSGGSLGTVAIRLDEPLPPGVQRTLVLERAVTDLPVRRTGVYPVQVVVRHAGGETTFNTAVPLMLQSPAEALNLVWVLSVDRPVAIPPDGVYPRDILETLALDELTQQLRTITRGPSRGLTLAPSPALLDLLADLGDGFTVRGSDGPEVVEPSGSGPYRARVALALLRRAAERSEVASAPYAAAHLPSLVANGLGNDLVQQISVGRSTIEARTGRAPSRFLVVPQGELDGATARALARLELADHLLDARTLPSLAEQPFRPDQFGPSRPVAVALEQGVARALVPDAALTERMNAPEQGVLLAQAVIAETASAYLELPLLAGERVLVMSSGSIPSPVALDAALDAVAAAPWVRLRGATDALEALPPQAPPLELLPQPTPERAFLAAARRARAELAALSSITVERLDEMSRLERLVLLAESAEWNDQPRAGQRLADTVTARVGAILRGIGVGSTAITLTARSGEVPITVFNENPFAVRVRVRLESPKVFFPSGSIRTSTITPPTERIDVPVEARAAGAFPLAVRIETPDGRRVLARGELILRSTAISTVALGVVGGSAALLVVAWVRRSRKRPSTG